MNMSHCRFENTLEGLRDCVEYMEDELSESEERYRKRLLELIKELAIGYCNLVEDKQYNKSNAKG